MNTLNQNPNKFVEQRRKLRLDGICALMVEYGVTIQEIEQYFLYEYETPDAEMSRKRRKHKQKPIIRARAANAVRTRWDRHEALKTSHIVAKEDAKARIAAVPQPDFTFADEMQNQVVPSDLIPSEKPVLKEPTPPELQGLADFVSTKGKV